MKRLLLITIWLLLPGATATAQVYRVAQPAAPP